MHPLNSLAALEAWRHFGEQLTEEGFRCVGTLEATMLEETSEASEEGVEEVACLGDDCADEEEQHGGFRGKGLLSFFLAT